MSHPLLIPSSRCDPVAPTVQIRSIRIEYYRLYGDCPHIVPRNPERKKKSQREEMVVRKSSGWSGDLARKGGVLSPGSWRRLGGQDADDGPVRPGRSPLLGRDP